MIKKLLLMSSLLAIFFTQTGFVFGLVTLNPALIAVGGVGSCCALKCIAGTEINLNDPNFCTDLGCKSTCVACCFSLGVDSSKQSSIGPFPSKGKAGRELAQLLHVDVKDIQEYNKHLDKNFEIFERISNFLSVKLNSYSWNGEMTSLALLENQMIQDSEFEDFARFIGFTDARDLVRTLQTNEVTYDGLNNFAAAVGMSPAVAQIFLQKAFLIHIKK